MKSDGNAGTLSREGGGKGEDKGVGKGKGEGKGEGEEEDEESFRWSFRGSKFTVMSVERRFSTVCYASFVRARGKKRKRKLS